MTTITRAVAKKVSDDIDKALAEIGERHGITLTTGSIRFGDSMFRAKIEGTAVASEEENAAKATLAEAEWNAHCSSFGLLPEQYGTTFAYRNSAYKVVGIKPRSSKYPVVAEDIKTGRSYKFPAWALSRA